MLTRAVCGHMETIRYAETLMNTMANLVERLIAQTTSMPDVSLAKNQLDKIDELLPKMPGHVGKQARIDIDKERRDIAKRVELRQRELEQEERGQNLGKMREGMVHLWYHCRISEAVDVKNTIERMIKKSISDCERQLVDAGPVAAIQLILPG
jgi:hypothetical protein